MTWANKVRIGWGLGYFAAAFYTLVVILNNPDPLLDWFLENAQLDIYRDMVNDFIIPNGSVFVVLMVLIEVVIGLLILHKNRVTKLGLVLAILWPAILVPLTPIGPEMAVIILIAIGPVLLLLRKYETTFWTSLLDWA